MAELRISWFGSPQIRLDERPVRTERRKAVAMLAYLTLEPGAHRREHLAALFWPDFNSSSAHAYLRRTLWEINQMLGQEWLATGREEVSIDPSAHLWVDVVEFEKLIEHGLSEPDRIDALEKAAGLYRGDFLAGFSLRDSLEFDAWQQQRAESLRLKLFDALERLVDAANKAGNAQNSVSYASRWVGLDPLSEAAQRALMLSYALAGQRSAALRQYDLCTELLRKELGVEPEAETQQLAARIRMGDLHVPVSRPATGADEPSLIRPVPLPVYPTAFVGRETELQRIAHLLADPNCRLVNLLGLGGSGKTRLAVEVGQRNSAGFEHGVGFVSLAAICEVESILPAIGRALNLTYRLPGTEEVPITDSQTQLFSYIREKCLLLITDNWEHLLEGVPVLSKLLAVAPGLKILATSRERLNLPEEWIFDVGGLDYPATVSDDGLEKYSAYQLFVQSARRSISTYSPDQGQKACIAELCRLLEGLPLGIELAASWVRTMECSEIIKEIRRNINFLETSLRGVPERHRSLRAVFDHSWELLDEPQREIMKRLSVFRGGFNREAAKKVAKASLSQLAALIDKSLITRDVIGRYGMHEVLKQFSAERLEEDPDLYRKTHDAHSTYFLDWLIAARQSGIGAKQKEILRQFDLEIENVGAACLWAIDQKWWPQLIQALPVLFRFHDTSSSYRYSEEILRSSVDRFRPIYQSQPDDEQILTVMVLLLSLYSNSLLELNQMDAHRTFARECFSLLQIMMPSENKAWALTFLACGFFFLEQPEVIKNIQAVYALFEKSGERRGMAIALAEWAGLLDQKEYRTASLEAISMLKQAVAWMEELEDHWMRARFLTRLSQVHNFHGEYLQARDYLLEALEIFEGLGDNWPVVDVRFELGQNAIWLGFYDQAEEYFKTNLKFVRTMGIGPYLGAHLDCLGYIEYLRGNYERAEAYYQESLVIYQRSHYPPGEAMVNDNLGDIARIQGKLSQAIEYYKKGIALLPADSEYWTRSVLVKNLGNTMLDAGDLTQAELYLREAQKYAIMVERVPDILEIDMAGAKLFARRGEISRALEILAMVQENPASTQVVRIQVQSLLGELSSELPHDLVVEAVEKGKLLQPGCAFRPVGPANG